MLKALNNAVFIGWQGCGLFRLCRLGFANFAIRSFLGFGQGLVLSWLSDIGIASSVGQAAANAGSKEWGVGIGIWTGAL
jgi:hypothetical protein